MWAGYILINEVSKNHYDSSRYSVILGFRTSDLIGDLGINSA